MEIMLKAATTKIIFFLAIFIFFLLPPTDPDLGWQLRCGEQIWHAHNFCSQNQFSTLLENYAWTNHQWLYQIILYSIYQAGGFWGLSFLNTAVVGLSFLFFYLSLKNRRLEKILVILAMIYLGWGVFAFGIRSQLLGFLFFNLMLWIFSKSKENLRWAWLFPVVMLLWVNTHGSFVLGVILLIFFWPTVAKEGATKWRSYIFSFLPLVISFPMTLLNPFGLKIYREAFRHMLGPIDLSQLIAEWVPPAPGVWWLILLSSLGIFSYLLLTVRKRSLTWAFLILPFMVLSLKARRNLPFYLVIVFYLLFNFSSSSLRNLSNFWFKQKVLRKNLAFLASGIFLLMALSFRLPQTLAANDTWENFCQGSAVNYPCAAVKFLRNQPEKGAIFNRYEWGGFLIWQLPEQKIFVDGRMPAWTHPSGKSPYAIYLETLQTQANWEKTLNDYQINWILISPGTFLDLKLSPDPNQFGWQEVYRDKISVIYQNLNLGDLERKLLQ